VQNITYNTDDKIRIWEKKVNKNIKLIEQVKCKGQNFTSKIEIY